MAFGLMRWGGWKEFDLNFKNSNLIKREFVFEILKPSRKNQRIVEYINLLIKVYLNQNISFFVGV